MGLSAPSPILPVPCGNWIVVGTKAQNMGEVVGST